MVEPAVAIGVAMSILCALGLHRWKAKMATLNPKRLVRRCMRCAAVRVTLLSPRPSPPCSVRNRIRSAHSDKRLPEATSLARDKPLRAKGDAPRPRPSLKPDHR